MVESSQALLASRVLKKKEKPGWKMGVLDHIDDYRLQIKHVDPSRQRFHRTEISLKNNSPMTIVTVLVILVVILVLFLSTKADDSSPVLWQYIGEFTTWAVEDVIWPYIVEVLLLCLDIGLLAALIFCTYANIQLNVKLAQKYKDGKLVCSYMPATDWEEQENPYLPNFVEPFSDDHFEKPPGPLKTFFSNMVPDMNHRKTINRVAETPLVQGDQIELPQLRRYKFETHKPPQTSPYIPAVAAARSLRHQKVQSCNYLSDALAAPTTRSRRPPSYHGHHYSLSKSPLHDISQERYI